MKTTEMYRHGDLFIRPIAGIPLEAQAVDDKILAYGEATGHKHLIVGGATVYRTTDRQFIEIVAPSAKLVHEEHKEIELPRGMFEVIRQREFDPYSEAVRNVAD